MADRVIHLIDRSRITTDWACKRRRYLAYDYRGRGLASEHTSLELALGIVLHEALAEIAIQQLAQGGQVDIDHIACSAAATARDGIRAATAGEIQPDEADFADEQAALVEGLVRGFYRAVWPRWVDQYRIVEVEREMIYPITPSIHFMSRQDLLLEDRADGSLWYTEYKSTSSRKQDWINSWGTAVQLHSSIRAIEHELKREVAGVIVQGLYKGYQCLVPNTPVLTADLRWIRAGELQIGTQLAGFDEEPTRKPNGRRNKRQWKTATVTNVGRAQLPCYRLTFADGAQVECSENHLWLTTYAARGTGAGTWTKTKDLTTLSRVVKVIEPWDMREAAANTYNNGYLAAAFDGEGHLSQHQTPEGYWLTHLGFTQKQNPMLKRVIQMLRADNIKLAVTRTSKADGIEGRAIYIYGVENVLCTLGRVRPARLLPKFSFDKLGGMTMCKPSVRVTNIEPIWVQEVVTLGTSTKTLIANGFATHNSYGRQNSPFCYAYVRAGNPPFTADQVQYEYTAGFRRQPTWTRPGGVAAWVAGMPEGVLADQFPQVPPIFVKGELVDAFFRQVQARETEIMTAKAELAETNNALDDAEVLDRVFPQSFDQCSPQWGRPCAFRRICHGRVDDPLTEGWVQRTPHHQPEVEQWAEEDGHES